MTLIKPTYQSTGKLVYRDTRTDVLYRRIVGALAWPSPPKAGFLVVVAEEEIRDKELGAFKLQIIAEREKESLAELYQAALELQVLCAVNGWRGNIDNLAAVRYFGKLNGDRGYKNPVTVYPAMYAQDKPNLSVYQQIILDLGRPNRVIIFFNDTPLLETQIGIQSSEDALKPAEQYPALAALGYAAAEMVMRTQGLSPVLKQAPVTEWDLYA